MHMGSYSGPPETFWWFRVLWMTGYRLSTCVIYGLYLMLGFAAAFYNISHDFQYTSDYKFISDA